MNTNQLPFQEGVVPPNAPPKVDGFHGVAIRTKKISFPTLTTIILSLPFILTIFLDFQGPSRIGLRGDLALEDAAVRQASSFTRTLGVYDRFGWHHLGPAVFYIMAAPAHIFGSGQPSEYAAMAAWTAVCFVTPVRALWRAFDERVGIAAAVTISAFLALNLARPAFGPTSNPLGYLGSPWNPYITAPALICATLCSLAAWKGDRAAFGWTILSATVALQAHVASTFPVALCGLLLVVASLRLRSPGLTPIRTGRTSLYVTTAIAALLWFPVLLNAVSNRGGNLRKVASYFFHENATHAVKRVLQAANAASSAGLPPQPGVRDAFLGQGYRPATFVLLVALPTLLLSIYGWRRRNFTLVAFAAMTISLWILTAASAHSIAGAPYRYLLAWAVITPIPTWVGVTTAVLQRVPSSERTLTIIGCSLAFISCFLVATGPPLRAAGDPNVVRLAHAIELRVPRSSSVLLTTNRARSIRDFALLVGCANELNADGFHSEVSGHPVEIIDTQFTLDGRQDFHASLLSSSSGDTFKRNFVLSEEGMSLFLYPLHLNVQDTTPAMKHESTSSTSPRSRRNLKP